MWSISIPTLSVIDFTVWRYLTRDSFLRSKQWLTSKHVNHEEWRYHIDFSTQDINTIAPPRSQETLSRCSFNTQSRVCPISNRFACSTRIFIPAFLNTRRKISSTGLHLSRRSPQVFHLRANWRRPTENACNECSDVVVPVLFHHVVGLMPAGVRSCVRWDEMRWVILYSRGASSYSTYADYDRSHAHLCIWQMLLDKKQVYF